jgi:diguanylate cyclase (GGDEF)-like protein
VKHTGISLSIGATLLLLLNYILLVEHTLFRMISFLFIILFLLWMGNKHDRLKYLSEKDHLTNTYTRRFVSGQFLRLSKKSRTMHVFLLDLNNFKMINDQYGHDAGDEVLSNVAHCLKNSAGSNDIVGRWGGDEFIILSTSASPDYLTKFSNKLTAELKQYNENNQLNVEFSIGKAVFPLEGKTLNELLKVADKNMYRKKGFSRNEAAATNETTLAK